MSFSPRSQPYRLDFSGNHGSLGRLFRDADEMFQILFDDLGATFGAIGDVGVDYQAWDGNLDGLSNMTTLGVMVRTSSEHYATRTITAGTGITVTNGDGIAGNPTIALSGSGGGSGPSDGNWSPLTNGDGVNPELIFDIDGDTIAVWT